MYGGVVMLNCTHTWRYVDFKIVFTFFFLSEVFDKESILLASLLFGVGNTLVRKYSSVEYPLNTDIFLLHYSLLYEPKLNNTLKKLSPYTDSFLYTM